MKKTKLIRKPHWFLKHDLDELEKLAKKRSKKFGWKISTSMVLRTLIHEGDQTLIDHDYQDKGFR